METFADSLFSVTDDCGTISWSLATCVAKHHNLLEQFQTEYGNNPFRVDTGEFLVWLGY